MDSVQSIQRAFRILQEVGAGPVGVSALARRVELPNTTVARILKTLQNLEVVTRHDDGRFALGSAALRIFNQASNSADVRSLDHATLVTLATQLEEIAGLSVREGRHVLYVAQADGAQQVQVRDWTGERVPLHVVSSGLIYLAFADEYDLEEYLARDLQRFTEYTQADPMQIRRRVDSIRRLGYVWTKEEFHLGINSIAAPIFNAEGALAAALHSHGPSYRFPSAADGEHVAAQIAHSATSLSHTIGWSGAGAGNVAT